MEPGFIAVRVAVLLVTNEHTAMDETTVKYVIEKLTGAGHRMIECQVLKDTTQLVKAQFLRWFADPEVDVVIAVAGNETDATRTALTPLITKPIEGFTDLFRMLTFGEIGTGAMLVDVMAAQCGSTFVFVLPASQGAVKTAVEKLLIPQLDSRTKPKNLVTRMAKQRKAVAPPAAVKPAVAKPAEAVTELAEQDMMPSDSIPIPIRSEKTASGVAPPPRAPARRPTPPPPPPRRTPTPPPVAAEDLPEAMKQSPVAAEAIEREPERVAAPPSSVITRIPLAKLAAAQPKGGFIEKTPTITHTPAAGVPIVAAKQTAVGVAPVKPASVQIPTVVPAKATTPAPGVAIAADAPKPAMPPVSVPSSPATPPSGVPVGAGKPTTPPTGIEVGAKVATPPVGVPVGAGKPKTPPSGIAVSAKGVPATPPSGIPVGATAGASGATTTPVLMKPTPPPAGVSADRFVKAVTPVPGVPIARHAALVPDPDRVAGKLPSIAKPKSEGETALEAAWSATPAAATTTNGATKPVAEAAPAEPVNDGPSKPNSVVPITPQTANKPGSSVVVDDDLESTIDHAEVHGSVSAHEKAKPPPIVEDAVIVEGGLQSLIERTRKPTPPPIPAKLVPLPPVVAKREVAVEPMFDSRELGKPRKKRNRTRALALIALGAAALGGGGVLAFDAMSSKPKHVVTADLPKPPPPPPKPVVAIDAAVVEEIDAAPPEIDMVAPPVPPTPDKPDKPQQRPRPDRPKPDQPKPDQPEKPDGVKLPDNPKPTGEECDEVSCVLDKYQRPCCQHWKPAEQPKIVPTGVPEELDAAMIKAGVNKMRPVIIRCGEKTSAKGTVKVAVTVAADGHVTDVSVASSPDGDLGECVAAALRKTSFARTQNGGSFNYPFIF